MNGRAVIVVALWTLAFAIAGFTLSASYLSAMTGHIPVFSSEALRADPREMLPEISERVARGRLGVVVGTTFLFGLIGLAVGRADVRRP